MGVSRAPVGLKRRGVAGERGSELAQVMPKPREVAPRAAGFRFRGALREHLLRKLRRPPRYLVQMAVKALQVFARLAHAACKRDAIRREKRLPIRAIARSGVRIELGHFTDTLRKGVGHPLGYPRKFLSDRAVPGPAVPVRA